jgi:hypothetical protein
VAEGGAAGESGARREGGAAAGSGATAGSATAASSARAAGGVTAGGLGHVSGLNTGGLLYGTIVSAAALAVGATRGDTARGMFETMVSTLLIYWFAHIYTATVSARTPGNTVPLYRLIAVSAKHESSILVGGLPAVAVVAILTLTHVSLWITVLSDLGTVIVVLALDGLLAGLHAGTRGWRLGVEAGSAAIFGGMIAALLVTLHH